MLLLWHWQLFLGVSAVDNRNNYLHSVWETLITKCRVETDEWICPFRCVLILILLLQGKMLKRGQDSTESCCQKWVCHQHNPQGSSLTLLHHIRFHFHPTPVSRYTCCKKLPGSLHSSVTSYHKLIWEISIMVCSILLFGYITL